MKQRTKQALRKRRQQRIRAKISGSEIRPRIAVFRSHQHLYVQFIDDTKGQTLVSASDKELENGTPIEKARQLGLIAAKKAQEKHIAQAVFDRSGYAYHGRVKAIAEGIREGGLQV
ncbi:MAG: 50S ribosomal protein L18 [Candidatus Wildermuthbacteria bacterium]|nr:50S ribosomal protein L18 [Candidatus Wildermuthbacteria bacterium]